MAKTTDYKELCTELRAIVHGIPHFISNLSNASALIWEHTDDINWAGFYLMEDGQLVLGPFQGKIACIEIPVGSGVCGTAVAQDRTQVVKDVHLFEGHIACDSASNSEIVVPIHKDGRVVAVLDIDSTSLNRFCEADGEGFEAVCRVLEEEVF